ncbi:UDP-N-acetylglucosamine 2-epimerase (non-hydrolyzing) [Desulfitispora alkaliphila]
MAAKAKVMTIFGTRPEAIKMAPLVKELEQSEVLESVVTVTAQHREMLDQVMDLFKIVPDYDLNLMRPGQTLFTITAGALTGLEGVLKNEKPDLVLVHGDTTTTFVAGLASFYLQIPVGHVEAGLRTGNKLSPFPEEMNRRLTGVVADLHFAPTVNSGQNLLDEGISPESIYTTGNTVIDALKTTVDKEYTFDDPVLKQVDFDNKKVILVTAHRRENLGEPMARIFRGIRRVLEQVPEAEVIFPVHKNPKVREVVEQELGDIQRVHQIEPLDYEPFVNLLQKSYLIMTDSGGIQEEAPSLGKPVLVLRDTTERPEAVNAGTVRLVGTDAEKVEQEALKLLKDPSAYREMSNAVNPYGDGLASRRIVQAIEKKLGFRKDKPEEFRAD